MSIVSKGIILYLKSIQTGSKNLRSEQHIPIQNLHEAPSLDYSPVFLDVSDSFTCTWRSCQLFHLLVSVPKRSSQLPAQHTTSWQRSGAIRLEKGPPTYHKEIYCGNAEKLAPLGFSQANEALNNTIGSKAPKTGIIDQVRAMTIM